MDTSFSTYAVGRPKGTKAQTVRYIKHWYVRMRLRKRAAKKWPPPSRDERPYFLGTKKETSCSLSNTFLLFYHRQNRRAKIGGGGSYYFQRTEWIPKGCATHHVTPSPPYSPIQFLGLLLPRVSGRNITFSLSSESPSASKNRHLNQRQQSVWERGV